MPSSVDQKKSDIAQTAMPSSVDQSSEGGGAELALDAIKAKDKPKGTGIAVFERFQTLLAETVQQSRSGSAEQRRQAKETLKLADSLQPQITAILEAEYLQDLSSRYHAYESIWMFALHWAWDSWWELPYDQQIAIAAVPAALSALCIHAFQREMRIYRPLRAEQDKWTYWFDETRGFFVPAATHVEIEKRILIFGILFSLIFIASSIALINAWYDYSFPFNTDCAVSAVAVFLLAVSVVIIWLAIKLKPHDAYRARTRHQDGTNLTGLGRTNWSDHIDVSRRHYANVERKRQWQLNQHLVRRDCYNSGSSNSTTQWANGTYGVQSNTTSCSNGTAPDCQDCHICDTDCASTALIPNTQISTWSPAALIIVLVIVFAVTAIVLSFCLCKRSKFGKHHVDAVSAGVTPEKLQELGAAPDAQAFCKGIEAAMNDGLKEIPAALERLNERQKGGQPQRSPHGSGNGYRNGSGSRRAASEDDTHPDVSRHQKELDWLQRELEQRHYAAASQFRSTDHILHLAGAYATFFWMMHRFRRVPNLCPTIQKHKRGDKTWSSIASYLKLETLGPHWAMMIDLYTRFQMHGEHLLPHYWDDFHDSHATGATDEARWQAYAERLMRTTNHDTSTLEAEFEHHIAAFRSEGRNLRLCTPDLERRFDTSNSMPLRWNPVETPFVWDVHTGRYYHSCALLAEHQLHESGALHREHAEPKWHRLVHRLDHHQENIFDAVMELFHEDTDFAKRVKGLLTGGEEDRKLGAIHRGIIDALSFLADCPVEQFGRRGIRIRPYMMHPGDTRWVIWPDPSRPDHHPAADGELPPTNGWMYYEEPCRLSDGDDPSDYEPWGKCKGSLPCAVGHHATVREAWAKHFGRWLTADDENGQKFTKLDHCVGGYLHQSPLPLADKRAIADSRHHRDWNDVYKQSFPAGAIDRRPHGGLDNRSPQRIFHADSAFFTAHFQDISGLHNMMNFGYFDSTATSHEDHHGHRVYTSGPRHHRNFDKSPPKLPPNPQWAYFNPEYAPAEKAMPASGQSTQHFWPVSKPDAQQAEKIWLDDSWKAFCHRFTQYRYGPAAQLLGKHIPGATVSVLIDEQHLPSNPRLMFFGAIHREFEVRPVR